jgi:predicted site-specific integrase-resolvase
MEELLLEKYGPLMDLPEIAFLLKIEPKSMYQQIYRGKLNVPHIKHGKKYLFPTPEVASYLESKIVNYPVELL